MSRQPNQIRLPGKNEGQATFHAVDSDSYVHVWFDQGVAQTDFGHPVRDSGEWQVVVTTSPDPLNIKPRGRELARETFRYADPRYRDLVYSSAQEFVRSALFQYRNNPEENPNRRDVIDAWRRGEKLKASALRTEDGKLYSYALLIGETLPDGTLVVYDYTGPRRKSQTTTVHVGAAKAVADEVHEAPPKSLEGVAFYPERAANPKKGRIHNPNINTTADLVRKLKF